MPGFEELFRGAIADSTSYLSNRASKDSESLTHSHHSIPQHVKRWAFESSRTTPINSITHGNITNPSYNRQSKSLGVVGGGLNASAEFPFASDVSRSGDSKSENMSHEVKVRASMQHILDYTYHFVLQLSSCYMLVFFLFLYLLSPFLSVYVISRRVEP
jgi:hypothetical protein